MPCSKELLMATFQKDTLVKDLIARIQGFTSCAWGAHRASTCRGALRVRQVGCRSQAAMVKACGQSINCT